MLNCMSTRFAWLFHSVCKLLNLFLAGPVSPACVRLLANITLQKLSNARTCESFTGICGPSLFINQYGMWAIYKIKILLSPPILVVLRFRVFELSLSRKFRKIRQEISQLQCHYKWMKYFRKPTQYSYFASTK